MLICTMTTFFHVYQTGGRSARKLGCKLLIATPQWSWKTQAKGAERTLLETLVRVGRAAGRQAESEWKRELFLNVQQGLCFGPVA